jgi:hypothetical protein
MIWHIFKKDWKLQWRFAVLMALAQLGNAALLVKLSPFQDSASLRALMPIMILTLMVGIPFLIVAVVHQDAIPGVQQDWLVRPIRRRDLLLAKFLFVLVAVHGPMLLADLFRGLADGFAFGPSLAAAGSHGLFVLAVFSIPLFAFASLTRNLIEATVAGLSVFLCCAGFQFLLDQTVSRQLLVAQSGLAWIPETAQHLVGLIGAGAVLACQYFRRRTNASRGLAAAAVAVVLLCAFVPWRSAFALEQRLSPDPSAGSAVAVTFDPGLGKGHRVTALGAIADREGIYLPLRFENLPSDSALISDRAEVHLKDASGTSALVGSGTISVRQGTKGEVPATHLEVFVRGDIYRRIENQPGQLEIGLWLTLFRGTGARTLPALGGTAGIPDLGNCRTKINDTETGIRLGCVPLQEAPSCYWGRLQNIPNGNSNPASFECEGDYAPYFDELLILPPRARSFQFRDLSGLAKFPVDGSRLGNARIASEVYEPADHFRRTVTIPSTRLRDWTAE